MSLIAGIENVDGTLGEQIAWQDDALPDGTRPSQITIPAACELDGGRAGCTDGRVGQQSQHTYRFSLLLSALSPTLTLSLFLSFVVCYLSDGSVVFRCIRGCWLLAVMLHSGRSLSTTIYTSKIKSALPAAIFVPVRCGSHRSPPTHAPSLHFLRCRDSINASILTGLAALY